MEINAESPRDIPRAYSLYYSRLADTFVRLSKPLHPRTVLEAGCGKGQLTLPLINRLPPRTRLIGVDSSKGPYAGWLEELATKVETKKLANRIRIVKADARNLNGIRDASIDLIVSNELVCDLPKEHHLERAFQEFYRVLKPGGKMIHGEWSSSPKASPQNLRITHWPNWNPDQLFTQLERLNFHDIRATYFETTIKFGYKAALEELRTWGASETTIQKSHGTIKKNGIHLPFQHIIECRK